MQSPGRIWQKVIILTYTPVENPDGNREQIIYSRISWEMSLPILSTEQNLRIKNRETIETLVGSIKLKWKPED